ncbi:hypothetical protein C8R43DRAFT_1141369 [Mycena crocata]|nr:hypothetical protein C8R43DRAFT_1141369 [Mycena crocata]
MPRSRAAADAEYALDAVYIACPFIFAIFLNMKQERRYWKGLLTASTTAAKAALKLPWYRPSTVCRSENAKGMYLKNPVRRQVSREFSVSFVRILILYTNPSDVLPVFQNAPPHKTQSNICETHSIYVNAVPPLDSYAPGRREQEVGRNTVPRGRKRDEQHAHGR